MAKISKTRGDTYERAVAGMLTEHLGYVVRRQLGQARDGGGDILIGQFVLECKRVRRLGLPYRWMAQAEAAAKPGQVPIVVTRQDGADSLCIVRMADLIPMLREALL